MAYLFSWRQGISSLLQTIWGARIFHPVALLKLMFLWTWDGCLREYLNCCNGCQAPCCIWCGMRDGCGFNEGEMFFILSSFWGTPIYFAFMRWHQCSSLLVTVFLGILFSSIREIEVPYIFDWEQGTPQHEMQGNPRNAGKSGLFLRRGWSLMSFLELWQAPGVYSRVTSVMAIWNSGLFSDVRTPV